MQNTAVAYSGNSRVSLSVNSVLERFATLNDTTVAAVQLYSKQPKELQLKDYLMSVLLSSS